VGTYGFVAAGRGPACCAATSALRSSADVCSVHRNPPLGVAAALPAFTAAACAPVALWHAARSTYLAPTARLLLCLLLPLDGGTYAAPPGTAPFTFAVYAHTLKRAFCLLVLWFSLLVVKRFAFLRFTTTPAFSAFVATSTPSLFAPHAGGLFVLPSVCGRVQHHSCFRPTTRVFVPSLARTTFSRCDVCLSGFFVTPACLPTGARRVSAKRSAASLRPSHQTDRNRWWRLRGMPRFILCCLYATRLRYLRHCLYTPALRVPRTRHRHHRLPPPYQPSPATCAGRMRSWRTVGSFFARLTVPWTVAVAYGAGLAGLLCGCCRAAGWLWLLA